MIIVKKKLGIITYAVKYRSELNAAYSLEHLCKMLNGFISGEICIRAKKVVGRDRPLCFNEELIESIALIGYRVILKYCKGETPHPDRITVWEAGLAIAGMLEADGILPECVEETVYICGYRFHCQIYYFEDIGCFYIPKLPGEIADDADSKDIAHYYSNSRQWRTTKGRAANDTSSGLVRKFVVRAIFWLSTAHMPYLFAVE